MAKKLYEKFKQEYDSCICHDIQRKVFGRSFNLWDSHDLEEFTKAGGFSEKCPIVVGKAAAWVAEIILDTEEK